MGRADDIAIKVESVSKTFRLPHEKTTSIKGALINLTRHKRGYEKQQVLKDVSFEIKKGQFFGIVGRNGSGKSTMLKLLAGIYSADSGSIQVNGKLTPFIELGVGFNPELTGRENVYLNGALLGFNRREMAALYNDIVEFAELHRFMDQKLKNYSSGMQVRLAFSIAIRAQSDILVLDEVLAVGDAIFQQKCFEYFKDLKREKKTVVLVSHDSTALQQYCDNSILLNDGVIISRGQIGHVLNIYKESLLEQEELSEQEASKLGLKKRWGNQKIEVISAKITGIDYRHRKIFTDKDATLCVKVQYRANANCEHPVYGIIINDTEGQQMFASNTLWSQVNVPDVLPGFEYEVLWEIPNVFSSGSYFISPAVADSTGITVFDWRDALLDFKIRKSLESSAKINVAHNIEVKEIVKPEGRD